MPTNLINPAKMTYWQLVSEALERVGDQTYLDYLQNEVKKVYFKHFKDYINHISDLALYIFQSKDNIEKMIEISQSENRDTLLEQFRKDNPKIKWNKVENLWIWDFFYEFKYIDNKCVSTKLKTNGRLYGNLKFQSIKLDTDDIKANYSHFWSIIFTIVDVREEVNNSIVPDHLADDLYWRVCYYANVFDINKTTLSIYRKNWSKQRGRFIDCRKYENGQPKRNMVRGLISV